MYDVVIIGSGPAGLSAAVYAKRANLKVAVIEKEYEGTGQIAESSRVDNYLGLPGISGYELGENFRNHASDMGVEFIEQEVTRLRQVVPRGEDETSIFWEITGNDDFAILSEAVIYATGTSQRKLGKTGEDLFLGKGISFCAICDGAFYKGKNVAVIGGGDTALDDALYLSDIAAKVYLIHRRDQFRGAGISQERLKARENVEFILNSQVEEFLGDEKLSAIKLSNRLGEKRQIEVDGVFEAIGSVPSTDLISGYVKLDESGYVIASEDGITEARGLFVAGDVRSKQLRQVVTAVSDGANAISSVLNYLSQLG